jgi:uncharacterized protein
MRAARGRSTIERHFTAAELPRLLDANADNESQITARFSFAQLEGHAAIDGELAGSVMLMCQRCMQPVAVAVDERFQVVLVSDEDAVRQEFGGYEPIAVDATQLDLKWLAEEQTLLALPLVPMHEPGRCTALPARAEVVADAADARQKPFGNLRDLLQKH